MSESIERDEFIRVWSTSEERALSTFGFSLETHEVTVLKHAPETKAERAKYLPEAKLFGLKPMAASVTVTGKTITPEQCEVVRQFATKIGDHVLSRITDASKLAAAYNAFCICYPQQFPPKSEPVAPAVSGPLSDVDREATQALLDRVGPFSLAVATPTHLARIIRTLCETMIESGLGEDGDGDMIGDRA